MLNTIMFLAIGFLIGLVIAIYLGKIPFFKDLFSENSTASFGRVGAGVALVAVVGWVSWVVYKTNVIPELGGAAVFIGTLYGLSAAKSAVKAFSGSEQPK